MAGRYPHDSLRTQYTPSAGHFKRPRGEFRLPRGTRQPM